MGQEALWEGLQMAFESLCFIVAVLSCSVCVKDPDCWYINFNDVQWSYLNPKKQLPGLGFFLPFFDTLDTYYSNNKHSDNISSPTVYF